MSNYLDEALGYMYIAEQVSPEENPVNNLRYNDKMGVTFVEFDTILQTFRCMNRNHRMYYGNNIQDNLMAERIQSMLKDNAWYGEMDHPTQETKNAELTPERIQSIWMPNRSHKIMVPQINGDIMTAKIQTASGTEAGRGFALEILQGLIPSFSCRAVAALQNIDGKPVVMVRKLITYDWVLYPSHKEAKIQDTPRFINKAVQTVTESVKDTFGVFKEKSRDVLIPLKEILENVGRTDINTQVIMESFDLSFDNLVGFDKTNDHIIIRDNDNMIYANISPKSKREVKDFLSSF